jgi:hypothetical protein
MKRILILGLLLVALAGCGGDELTGDTCPIPDGVEERVRDAFRIGQEPGWSIARATGGRIVFRDGDEITIPACAAVETLSLLDSLKNS